VVPEGLTAGGHSLLRTWTDSVGTGKEWRPMADFCEHGEELPGNIKAKK
jgi:hypothetical protein